MEDLIEILRFAPKNIKLYCTIWGECVFTGIKDENVYLRSLIDNCDFTVSRHGRWLDDEIGECVLFPSIDHRYWRTGWQRILFPQSIGGVVVMGNNEKYLIISSNKVMDCLGNEYEIQHCIDARYANTSEFADFHCDFVKNGHRWDPFDCVVENIEKDITADIIGKWVVSDDDDDYRVQLIEREGDGGYYASDGTFIGYDFLWKHYHLWTIKDAKKGDILIDDHNNIVVFDRIDTDCKFTHSGKAVIFTALYSGRNKGCEKKENCGVGSADDTTLHPVTTHEKLLFFEEFRKCGYCWDESSKSFSLMNILKITPIPVGKWFVAKKTVSNQKRGVEFYEGKTYQCTEPNAIKNEYGGFFVNMHDGRVNDLFKPWTPDDINIGDLVTYGDIIVIVSDCDYTNNILLSYCDYNKKTGILNIREDRYTGLNSFEPVTKEDELQFFESLIKKGYIWSPETLTFSNINVEKGDVERIRSNKDKLVIDFEVGKDDVEKIKYVGSDTYMIEFSDGDSIKVCFYDMPYKVYKFGE